MFLKQFLKNDAILDTPTLNLDKKMALQRQQVLLINNVACGINQRTKLDLLQNQLNYLQGNHAVDYYETHATKVKEYVAKVKSAYVDYELNTDSLTTVVGDSENGCHGKYESCQYMEPTEDYLQNMQKCLIASAKKQQNAMEAGTSNATEVRRSANIFNRRFDEQPSTSAQVPKKQAKENSINIAYNLQPNRQLNAHVTSPVDTANSSNVGNTFRTAREELIAQNAKNKNKNVNTNIIFAEATKRSLGGRRTVKSAFVPPFQAAEKTGINAAIIQEEKQEDMKVTDERMLNIDPKMIELIKNEIMHKLKPIDWHEIAGLEYAKSIIKEAVVYPLLRPDIFTGLRRPPRGILLFGPPGTGKTLIGKCIASQSNATFFSISASSLTSKWIGESEKMVRALFAVATVKQPAVVFIDEIDSLLSQRSDYEHESSRRLKTEFLVQLDGAATCEEDRVLIVGATNRPQELDEAARRRLVRRLYIPLPECEARYQILKSLLQTVRNNLSEVDIVKLSEATEGYSGADMKTLCHEASMEPIRSIPSEQIPYFKADTVRAVNFDDFKSAMEHVRPSVSQADLKQYTDWNKIYGACV